MRYLLPHLLVGLFVLIPPVSHAQHQMPLEDTDTPADVRSYYAALGDFFHVPHKNMEQLRKQNAKIQDEEWPVVLLIARWKGKAPDEIIALREGGASWAEIVQHCNLCLNVLYLPYLAETEGGYAKVASTHQRYHENNCQERISDASIVNIVNFGVFSLQYACSPKQIVALRREGKSFVAIHVSILQDQASPRADNPIPQ